jgi:hypothetical protein
MSSYPFFRNRPKPLPIIVNHLSLTYHLFNSNNSYNSYNSYDSYNSYLVVIIVIQ